MRTSWASVSGTCLASARHSMNRYSRVTILLSSLLAAAAVTTSIRVRPAKAALGDPPARVVADLSARRLSILEGDEVVESFPVAIGKGSKPTPTGNYRIRKIVWNP